MSAKSKHYWQIGHKSPDDVIWLMSGYDFNAITAGPHFHKGPCTHEMLFGKDSENYWRGRYERLTGFCSILPPALWQGHKRPPQVILDTLKARFSVVRFYFFSDGVESFTPNPERDRA